MAIFLDARWRSLARATEFFIGLKYALVPSAFYKANFSQQLIELQTKLDYFSVNRVGSLAEHRSGGQGFFYNYLRNLFLWPHSFLASALFNRFQGVPAIICGAGPSLAKQAELLHEVRDRAFIFAGGTAMNGINAFSLLPHAGVGIDPNMAQLSRTIMNTAYETPFFYRNRMYAHALKHMRAPLLHVPGSIGYKIAEYFEQQLGQDNVAVAEGYNVINFSLSIAAAMGCSPIILVGVDLAYTNGLSYSSGIVNHPIHHQEELFHTKNLTDELVFRNDIYGNLVATQWKWVNESTWFAAQAAAKPDMQLINATEGGIGFHGVPNMPLKTVFERFLDKSSDLDLRLFGEMQAAPMPPQVNQANIVAAMEKLLHSLQHTLELLEEGDIELFKAEIAYTYVLQDFERSFEDMYKKEIWRQANDKALVDPKIWQTRQGNLDAQKRAFFKQIALSLAKQIQEVLMQVPAVQNKSVPFQRAALPNAAPENPLAVKEESWHPNGRLKMQSMYRGDKLHGQSTFYSADGQLLGRTWFEEGLRQGGAERYYASGALFAALNFKDGKADGVQRYYHEDGSQRSEIAYRAGVLHGDVRLFYSDGHMARQLHFCCGKRQGQERIWSASGQLLIEAHFDQDRPTGLARVWHGNGTLAYENQYDKPHFKAQIWNDCGHPIVAEGSKDYFKGVASGTDRLTNEIVTTFQLLNSALFTFALPDEKMHIQQTLATLKAEVLHLQALNKQISVESGLSPIDQKEHIWKTPSAEQQVEAQVSTMTAHIKDEFIKLQTLLINLMPDHPIDK